MSKFFKLLLMLQINERDYGWKSKGRTVYEYLIVMVVMGKLKLLKDGEAGLPHIKL